jgi:hypothetical protein
MFFEFLLPNLIFIMLASGAGVWLVYITRQMRAQKTLRLVGMLLLITCTSVLLSWHNFALSLVPDALEVTSVEYSKGQSLGLGPGDDDAGMRIYPLRDSVARAIEKQGLPYFWQMPLNANQHKREWRGAYGGWQQTPLPPAATEDAVPVYKYLHISTDQAMVDDVSAMLTTSGSYYAYGYIGMIVVSPNRHRVVYLYNR